MRKRWSRWRGYEDEVEEALRLAGEQLSESEGIVAERYEIEDWPAGQRGLRWPELVRRALDIPFLGDLIRAANGAGPLDELAPPDFEGQPWRSGQTRSELRSTERRSRREEVRALPIAPGDDPPARLRAAERALAHRTRSLVVVLDDLVVPRNAAAVARTADALGLQELHIIQREGRARFERGISTLSQRWLDLFWYRDASEAMEVLRERGHRILAADFGPASLPLDAVPLGERVAVVFGSEQRGVSDTVRAAADGLFHVPASGFTSYLNVSVAAGIALYTLNERMSGEGLRAPLDPSDTAVLRKSWYHALARGSRGREMRYAAWLEQPPEPAHDPRTARPGRRESRAAKPHPSEAQP